MTTHKPPGIVQAFMRWLQRDLVAIILFVSISLLLMSPVLSNPRALVIATPGDIYQHVYMTGWVAQALLLRMPPFLDPRLNYPGTLYLTATDVPLLNLLAVAPATWLFGPAAGYNLMVLLAHGLAGYVMYLWVRSLTDSRAGGIVAGTIFLLAPYRILRSMGHTTLMSTYVLVLFFWALEHALKVNRPEARRFVLLGFATFAVGMVSQYFLVICLIMAVAYICLRCIRNLSVLLQKAGPLILSIGCATLIAMIPYLMAVGAGVYSHYDVQTDIRSRSLDPLNFITPAAIHPIWGSVFQRIHSGDYQGEQTMYLGLIALGLAIVGIVMRQGRSFPVWTWTGVALVAAIFAFGTDLHLNGKPVSEEHPVWLPAYYLANIPLINLARAWTRFGIITQLFVTVLAGIGAAALTQRLKRSRVVGIILFSLVVLDFLPGRLPSMPIEARPIDQWLAQQPGDFAVAYLPPGEVVANYKNMYGSLFHGKHLPAFNHPEHRPAEYLDFQRRAHTFPEHDTINALRALHLQFLLIDRQAYDGIRWPAWQEVEQTLRSYSDIEIIGEQGEIVIVKIR